jgi:hypothetical protein
MKFHHADISIITNIMIEVVYIARNKSFFAKI